ncbi:MAG: hypothetical protein HC836_11285 [Richelia sp. RM2_1_2]|nr:hypothetical protein [Richelia sp. RM2_1_2]
MQIISILAVVKAVASIVDQLLTMVVKANVEPKEKLEVVDELDRVKAKLSSVQFHTEQDINFDDLA